MDYSRHGLRQEIVEYNIFSYGGSLWYGNIKSTQELAKDAFDALNNQKVFAP